jgi:hypothetical protein
VQAVENYIGKRSWSELGPRKSPILCAGGSFKYSSFHTPGPYTRDARERHQSNISGKRVETFSFQAGGAGCAVLLLATKVRTHQRGRVPGRVDDVRLGKAPCRPINASKRVFSTNSSPSKKKIGFFLASKKRVPEAAERLNAQTIDFPVPTYRHLSHMRRFSPRPDVASLNKVSTREGECLTRHSAEVLMSG